MEKNNQQYIYGIRTVIEAINAGQSIDKVLVKKDLSGEMARELFNTARERDIFVQRVPIERINRVTRKNHQGVLAIMSAIDYCRVEQVLPMLYEEGKMPFLVVLDGVTDVRNFGAIARTCECAGVDAIVIAERGSVSVTADAVKTSAGALNYLPVCRERNLADAVKYLRDSGLTIVATSDKNAVEYTCVDYTTPVALVLGSEDKGISPQIEALADERVVIPERGHIRSLNVGAAAAITIYEVVRQRNIGYI